MVHSELNKRKAEMFDAAGYGIMADGRDIAAGLMRAVEEGHEIVLEKGTYLSSPIKIGCRAHIRLEEGAELKFIPDFTLYPPVFTRWEGVRCWCMHPCLFIENAEDVLIDGDGTIDGSGEAWWAECSKKREKEGAVPETEIEKKFAALNPDYKSQPGGGGGRGFQFLRPPLIQIKNSRRVTLSGITVQNSPFWTIHPLYSEDIMIDSVKVINPYEAPNTDGIDVESSMNVTVRNSFVFVGDDGIAIKSGSGEDGIADNKPCRDVHIMGCTVKSAHGGAVIGSETAGEISSISVEDCVFDGTDRGIRIKSRRGRGGCIHGLKFRNIIMRGNLCPLVINMYYRCGADDPGAFSLDKQPVTASTPSVFDVDISQCHAIDSLASAGMLVGLPEVPVKGLSVRDCSFAVKKGTETPVSDSDMYRGLPDPPSRGLRIRNAEIHMENVEVTCEGERIIKEDNVAII